MINKTLIKDRLVLLDNYLDALRSLASLPKNAFMSDKRNAAATESFLRRSLEAIFDIGRHILAKSGRMDMAAEYKAIAKGLEDIGVVDTALSEKLVQMAGYRNRLVHMYGIISDEELYDIITTELGDIREFIAAIKEYIN
ncbi:type VII toxin-antitoxin system HepT family RNase toxin [Mahella australiensis]|uniref:DUF86 domain-containing protein n=1 Tax=Mahella australiensis (strain DSM 15567 / CIP 107919 / 50-1 BON) TaxID=697281 RepID=F3ZXM3_MAHA5|nr:DUF86 domain-containing protein [Mahella australiensis]AEE95530.1 protein of unknown function DUF86 [Mahella australiensis 50-1 BON]